MAQLLKRKMELEEHSAPPKRVFTVDESTALAFDRANVEIDDETMAELESYNTATLAAQMTDDEFKSSSLKEIHTVMTSRKNCTYHITLDELDCLLPAEEMKNVLSKNMTITNDVKTYSDKVYTLFYRMLCELYQKKLDESSSQDAIVLESLCLMIRQHREDAAKYLRIFTAAIENKTSSRHIDASKSSKHLKMLLASMVDDDENNKEETGDKCALADKTSVVDDEREISVADYFGTHSRLYESVIKPFTKLGVIFNHLVSIEDATFKSIQATSMKSLKDSQSITKEAIRLNLTRPALVRIESRSNKEYDFINVIEDDSNVIINKIKSNLITKMPVNKFHSSVSVACLKKMNTIYPCESISGKNFYEHALVTKQHTKTDLQHSVGLAFVLIDNIYVSVADESGFHQIRVYPKQLNCAAKEGTVNIIDFTSESFRDDRTLDL